MTSYAVFIEPDDTLRNYIDKKKLSVVSQLGHQKYVDHPPHMTLFHGALPNSEHWLERLDHPKVGELHLYCNDFQVFYDDPLCDGNHTLALKLSGEGLHQLQMLIANQLQNYVCKKPASFTDPSLQKSWDRYGFPFVGNHWIPHMTIASLDKKHCDDYLRKTLEETLNFHTICTAVSVWRVKGDTHTKLKELSIQ